MLDKSIKSRDKLNLTSANFHSLDLNRSITNSVLTSSYIILKDGTKKKKRHVNSYMEEFLEKRKMAAEFAQSKRSTSTKNYRVKLIKNEENMKDEEFNVNINIKNMEEIININNLKNNLPGKTTELIDNTNNNNIIQNKYDNYKRHNIIYTKKANLSQNNKYKNMNLSNHSFTEDRYNTNHENDDQCNIININNIKDISPIKTNQIILNAKGGIDEKEKVNKKEEEKNEIENKKLNNNECILNIMEKMINNNMNKQTSPNSLERDSFKFNNKYKEYEKFLNINDNKKEENKEDNANTNKDIKKEKLNLNIDNLSNNSTIKLNQEKNDDSLKKIKIKNEEYIVEENDEKNIGEEKEDENEENEQEKSIERQNEEEEIEEENNKINKENEEEENEDIERCEVLKVDGDKSKYLKGNKNIITEEIEEVEEGVEVNENTSEFPTIKSGRNKNSNRGLFALNLEKNSNSKENSINKLEKKDNNEEQKEEKEESFKIIKEEKKYNNVTKIEIKDLKKNKSNNINNNSTKNYNFIYSNTSNKYQRNIEKDNSIDNVESNNDNNNNVINKNNKEKEEDFSKNQMMNIKNNLLIDNDDFNFNKLSDINNINSEIIESPNDTNFLNYEKNNKEKEDFMRIINKDIERLEKIRNNNYIMNNTSKENESYIYEIDNFINLMREKRRSINNNIKINEISYKDNQDYIPPKNILELKKIYKNLNNINNKNNIDINIDTNYNNIIQRINYNKMKLPISKSTSLQSLLNEIKKEKTYNINIHNININNENNIINNNFFTEKINKEINDSFDKNNKEESKLNEDSDKSNFKLFDETKFRKIKETNLRKRNKIRNEFKFKDYETNKNLSHIYLDKVKEDILMNISATKISNKNEIKNRRNIKKINLTNNAEIEMDDSEIMPANNMKSLYINNIKF